MSVLPIIEITRTYRSTSQYPSQSGENERLEQPEHIQHPETLDGNTISRKINCERTINRHTHNEQKEPCAVPQTHTIVDEWTVMVEVRYASIAESAVFGTQRSQTATSVT